LSAHRAIAATLDLSCDPAVEADLDPVRLALHECYN